MTMRLILASSLISLLFVTGCCKAPGNTRPKENVISEPIWSQSLMVGSTASMVMNGGLGTPTKWGNDVIFSTTLTDDDEGEDNRLCGLDAKTGEIKWYFPSDTDQRYNYRFGSYGGRAYIWDDRLIVKSPPLGDMRPIEEVLCVDLTTRNLEQSFTTTGKQWYISDNCYGDGRWAVWDEHMAREPRIYKMDITSGVIETIVSVLSTSSVEANLNVAGFNGGMLIYTESANDAERSLGQWVCKFDVEANKLIYRKKVDLEYELWRLTISCFAGSVAYGRLGPFIVAIDTANGDVLWSVDTEDVHNYWVNHISVCGERLFLSGENIYMAIDRATGRILYKTMVEGCKWSVSNDGWVYVHIDENVHVLDCARGQRLASIVCPEKETNGDGFNLSIEPSFSDGKMYLMSYTTAYCYPAYPW